MEFCAVGKVPGNDDGYFEEMTGAIFRAGFSRVVIGNKWENFRRAFAGFSIEKVARFEEPDVDRLLKDNGIVRNYRKIEATISNAREMLAIQDEHGSFEKYLIALSKEGEEELCRAISKRFAQMGSATALFFLRQVGYEMPGMSEKWEKDHSKKVKQARGG